MPQQHICGGVTLRVNEKRKCPTGSEEYRAVTTDMRIFRACTFSFQTPNIVRSVIPQRRACTYERQRWSLISIPLKQESNHGEEVLVQTERYMHVKLKRTHAGPFCLFFAVFWLPPLLSPSFFPLSFLIVTQIRGHVAGSTPPSTLRSVP